MLTDKERRELQQFYQRYQAMLSQYPKVPLVKRISDAQGDRISVTQDNQHIEIPVISYQVKSNSSIN